MYWTHHFAHQETLTRACSWLSRLGIGPERMEAHTDGVPRLTLAVAPQQLAAIQAMIGAVERTDPEGWPSFWEVAAQPHTYPQDNHEEPPTAAESASSRATAIGWHPVEDPNPLALANELPRHWRWAD